MDKLVLNLLRSQGIEFLLNPLFLLLDIGIGNFYTDVKHEIDNILFLDFFLSIEDVRKLNYVKTTYLRGVLKLLLLHEYDAWGYGTGVIRKNKKVI